MLISLCSRWTRYQQRSVPEYSRNGALLYQIVVNVIEGDVAAEDFLFFIIFFIIRLFLTIIC